MQDQLLKQHCLPNIWAQVKCKRGSGECSLIVEVDEPGPELNLGRRALVLEDDHVLQDNRTVPQLPRDARVVLKKVLHFSVSQNGMMWPNTRQILVTDRNYFHNYRARLEVFPKLREFSASLRLDET